MMLGQDTSWVLDVNINFRNKKTVEARSYTF